MNKRFSHNFILIAVFLSGFYSVKGQDWKQTGPLPPAIRYEDVCFLNPLVGWTVASSGEIYKTTNGGESWETVYESVYYLRSIDFINDTVGFAGSLNGKFLRTEDGGTSWQEIQDSIPGLLKGICGLSHFGNTIYGVGVWSHPAFFIKSEDLGNTWTYLDLSEHASGLVDCHFIDENTGFAAGILEPMGGVILKTTDGGTTWKKVFSSFGGMEYIWKMFFVNDNVAYASIESFIELTSVAKTVDGGETWTQLEVVETMQDIQGIGFIDELKGWVGPRDHPLFETVDGGESWEQLEIMPNINRFVKTGELLYACGNQVYKYDENISTTEYPIASQYAHEIVLIQPNPFSNQLSISIEIDTRTNARLDIVSIDGKHFFPVYAGNLEAGKYEYLFDGNSIQMENGIYNVILRTDEGFKAEKIVRSEE